jgi:hypothetical protein
MKTLVYNTTLLLSAALKLTSLPAGRKSLCFEKCEGYNDLQQLQLSQYMHTCCVSYQSSTTAIYKHLAPSEYKKYRRIVV